MKLVGTRHSPDGEIRVAVQNADGSLTDVAGVADFWAAPRHWLDGDGTRSGHIVDAASVEIVPPVLPGAKVICVGLNYHAHHAEGSMKDDELPPFPTLFARWTSSLTVADVPVPVPADEDGLDWEGEIAAFIGEILIDADADTARASVVGYATFNDITSRRAQKLTSQWILGKNGDNSGPLGPLVTTDDVGDLRDGLRVQTRVNGTVVQDGDTRNMIYEVGEVLAFVSRTMTLVPGDILCTGTPEGVGYARTPPWLLGPGDVVEVEVDRLGVLRSPIVGNSYRHAPTELTSGASA